MKIENILFASDFPEDAKDFVQDRVNSYSNFVEDGQIVYIRHNSAYISDKPEYIVQVFILDNLDMVQNIESQAPFIIFFVGTDINR